MKKKIYHSTEDGRLLLAKYIRLLQEEKVMKDVDMFEVLNAIVADWHQFKKSGIKK